MTKDRKEGRRKRKEGNKGKQKKGEKGKRGKKEKKRKKEKKNFFFISFFSLSLDQQSALALLFCSLSCHVSWFCSSSLCFVTEY